MAVKAVDVHANGANVFDLDALAHEANQTPFQFRFAGEVYTCPGDLDILAVAALSKGELGAALERMLGEEQWERMLASPQVFTGPMLIATFEAYAQHSGTDLPNLSPSTTSSAPTAQP